MNRARITLILLAFSVILASGARAELTLTQPRVDWEAIKPHVGVLTDPTRLLRLQDVRAMSDDFAPVEGRSVNFGYTKSAIWLRLTLVGGMETDDWRLRFRENFFQNFAVWQVDPANGAVTELERQMPDSVFATRDIPYPELVTALTLPPGARADIYVRFWSGGSSELSFSVMTAAEFALWSAQKTAKNFFYYGMMLILIVSAALAWLVTGRTIFAAYAVYAVFALLFIAHADGNTFQYLWPNAPLFNGYASIVMGAGIIISGANFARQFLQTSLLHPVMDRLLLAVMAVAGLLVLATAVVDSQQIKRVLILLSLVAVALFTTSGLVAARTRFREVRFFVLAWAGAVISALIMNMRHWLGIDISEELQFDSMRLVFVLDAMLMGLAILDRVNQMRVHRQQALELSLKEAQKTMQLSARLAALEKRFRMAEDLAQLRSRSLANTVHDLRQPLHALRLNIHAVMSEASSPDPARLADVEDTFAYLEDLVTQELDQHGADSSGRLPRPEAESDRVAVGEVMRNVCDMFAADAEAKGLRLACVKSTARTRLPPLVLMRILSNLVANAVKYTDAGRVLVGVRRRGGHLWLEVHDTGRGLAPERFDEALARNGRLDPDGATPGHGLGLSVVRELARDHGARVVLLPRATGTSIAVRLP